MLFDVVFLRRHFVLRFASLEILDVHTDSVAVSESTKGGALLDTM